MNTNSLINSFPKVDFNTTMQGCIWLFLIELGSTLLQCIYKNY